MILVDTSALIAIMRKEPERRSFVQTIREDDEPSISVASILEATLMGSRALSRGAMQAVADHVSELGLSRVPLSDEHIRVACEAFFQFGKGQGSRAQLNFGDCMVYGTAKVLDIPVLFKGEDFARTDIQAAL